MSKIYYKEYGGGYPLIFLHGFCETNYVWQELAFRLENDFQIIALDLPGFGKSPLPEKPFSIDDIAKQVKDKISDIGVERGMIIGHSLGGYITLSFVRQFPNMVDRFCLFNSSAFADTPEKKENRNKLIELIEKNGTASFIQTFIPSLFYNQRIEEFRKEIELLREIGSLIQPRSVTAYAAAMRDRQDEAGTLKKYKEKALIIAGMEDKNVPVQASKKMGKIVGENKLHLLEKTAHMSMFECRDQVVDIFMGLKK